MNDALIDKLVAIVRQTLKQQQQQPRHSHKSIELILNESGVHGAAIGYQVMSAVRAVVYHSLGLGVCQPEALCQQLQGFIFDYDVFRMSELRYFFPGDLEADIFSHLQALDYLAKDVIGENEPVWRPKHMRRTTVLKQLAGRVRIGSKEYLAYLSYQPPKFTDTITRH